ncbi:MAG: 23S rRNA (uridine(2552)-2'-O)-methyltransferase RlmE [Pseudomonadota bacterium]
MARSKSSQRWLKEHFDDEYVTRAKQEGYRSRAVYKLEEIDRKARLLSPGQRVIDLGAAPGGWSQYVAGIVGDKGTVVASDILAMEPVPGVDFVAGDFREESVLAAILERFGGEPADLVISDMAPNMSGMDAVDQPRAMYLVELALDLARRTLRPGGNFVCKLFQGEGSDEFIAELKRSFSSVAVRKPKASRPRSREVYALCRGFRG